MFIDWSLLRFPFDDDRWKGKFAIGGLLYLVGYIMPIPFFVLYLPALGFGYQMMRRATRNEERRLSEWDDWGKLFADGLKVFGVGFVYTLPVTLLNLCAVGAYMAVLFGSMGLGANPNVSREAVESAIVASVFAFYGVIFVVIGCVFLLSIPLGYLAAVAQSRMAATDSFSSAFEFGEVWNLAKRGLPNYLIAVVAILGIAYGGALVVTVLGYTIVLACLYPFAFAFLVMYLQIIMSTMLGSAYYHTMGGKREDVKVALEASRKSTAPLNLPKQDHADLKDEFSTMPGTPSSITGTMISDKTPPASVEGEKKAAPKKRTTKKPGSASPNKGK